MSADKQRFVLYEYLLYFWEKKMLFLIIPPIVALAAFFGARLLLNDAKYTGKAVVFTGAINLKELTNPENIIAKFPDVKNKLDIVVTEEKYVKITVKGNDKRSVQQDLDYVVTHYDKQLQEHSQKRLEVTNEYLSSLDKRIQTLESSIDYYNEQLSSPRSVAQQQTITDLLTVAQNALTESMETANRIRGDLVFYEKPSVLSETVAPAKTYAKEAIASGLVLGVFLTFMLLALMKYLFDARRYYNG